MSSISGVLMAMSKRNLSLPLFGYIRCVVSWFGGRGHHDRGSFFSGLNLRVHT